jgi:hypothetical protein
VPYPKKTKNRAGMKESLGPSPIIIALLFRLAVG